MGSFRKLHTRERAEAGVRMDVMGPDGKPTGEWIEVRGQDADAFHRANRTLRRNLMQYLEKNGTETRNGDEYHAYAERENRKVQASLVKSWSFEEECTEDNIVELFINAPYVADQVDSLAGKREQFALSSPTNCGDTQSNNSDSANPQPPVQS